MLKRQVPKGAMRNMKKGTNIWRLIVILAVLGSVLSGMAGAANNSANPTDNATNVTEQTNNVTNATVSNTNETVLDNASSFYNVSVSEDSDGDGISDYDEFHGFTWENKTYFTNPYQASTDRDPYNDYKEITGINMSTAVIVPERHPCVPSYADLKVELEGIEVISKCKITSTKTKEKGESWHLSTETQKWTKAGVEAGCEYTPYWPPFFKAYGYAYAYYESYTHTVRSESGWSREEWSKATATDKDEAARLESHIKIKNEGTDAAKNVKLSFNVKIGEDKIADTVWTDVVEWRMEPGEVSDEMVIDHDRDGEIVITLEELKSIECGAPISIKVREVNTKVPWKDKWINWEDYKGEFEPVSSTIMADFGDGEVKEYNVWSGIHLLPEPPHKYIHNITINDAINRTIGIREKEDGVYIGWKADREVKLENWTFGFDNETFQQINETLPENWTLYDLLNVTIKQGWVIVMKAPDIKPPEIHWASYSRDMKGIKAGVSDNENITKVIAHVKIGDDYENVTLKDKNGDLVLNATLAEKIMDTEDDYIIASDGKFNIMWLNIQNMSRTITVDDDGNADFTRIQDAINASMDGDTVFVFNGTYYENVIVNKSIILRGEKKENTIINGSIDGINQTKPVIEVLADNCMVSEFTVMNGSTGVLLKSDNNIVTNIIARNMYYYDISYSGRVVVKVVESGECISLLSTSNNTIANCSLDIRAYVNYSPNFGIYLCNSTNNTLSNNNIKIGPEGNIGIKLWKSDHNMLSGNDIARYNIIIIVNLTTKSQSERESGIYLNESNNNSMINNYIQGSSFFILEGEGIYLKRSDKNKISNNDLSYNKNGVLFEGVSYNVIYENKLERNDVGINLSGGCFSSDGFIICYPSCHNLIYHNNFIDNREAQAYDDGYNNSWDNGPIEGGNYWSDHECEGNPSDGLQPYYIPGSADAVDWFPFQDKDGWLLEPPPSGDHNIIIPEINNSVLIGQELRFQGDDLGKTIIGLSPEEIEGITFGTATDDYDTSAYFTVEGVYGIISTDTTLNVNMPFMSLDLEVNNKSVSSIIQGTPIRINFTTNLNANDLVDLRVIDPDGHRLSVNPADPTQKFDGIKVSKLMEYGSENESKQINTNGWNIGEYEFSVRTEKENARELDFSSNTKALTVLKAEVDIDAEKTNVEKLEKEKLVVTGVSDHNITISSSNPTHTIFPAGYEDNPSYTTSEFNDTLDSDGQRRYVVYFNDTGIYIITVTDTTADLHDSVDIEVSVPISNIFDTGLSANPYPSISGTHNGTIKTNQTITVQKLYTYPCSGAGGHAEYARIWNNSGLDVNASWNGYVGDWHNISFSEPFTLLPNETYNYTIRTGSYPQIHHTPALPTANGWINCTEFTDVNGKSYTNWIPAIRLE